VAVPGFGAASPGEPLRSGDPAQLGPAVPSETGIAPDPRYADRRSVIPPPGSITDSLARDGAATVFSPVIADILQRMEQAEFTGHLADLSGENPVTVGGQSYTFTTRYSLVPAGQVCWQYAYEYLEAQGYDVRYQGYTRSGYDLENVVATLPGEVTPDQIYVIGGHIDSISPSPETLAPGAEDNGSGSSGVLAAAAALAGERFDSTIELVLFSGEEEGLWGSQAYVQEAVTEGRDVRAAVTMDMIAYYQDDFGVLIEGELPWIDLMETMADAVDAYTELSRDFSFYSFGSDHVPFQDAGIPAILAIDLDWNQYPDYHRTTDTFDKTTPGLGYQIASAGLATIAQLAGPRGSAAGVTDRTPIPGNLTVSPNPARARAEIRFARAIEGGGLRIFDVSGRLVRVLEDGPMTARTRDDAVVWNLRDDSGRQVRPGLYWIRGRAATGTVVIVR
jgi:hypothetical protein